MAEAVFDAEFILSRIDASKAAVEVAREMMHEKKIAELMLPYEEKGRFGRIKIRVRTREDAVAKYEARNGLLDSSKGWEDYLFDEKIEEIKKIATTCRLILRIGDSSDGLVTLSDYEISILDI